MKICYFAIPALDPGAASAELNGFLSAHRVLRTEHEFVNDGSRSYWAVRVEILVGAAPNAGRGTGSGGEQVERKRVDYRELLSPEDFSLFVRLREWRKSRAEVEAVPVFTIFTNAQLAAVAQARPRSASALREIEGIGEGRAQKYAEELLTFVARADGNGGTDAVGAVPDGE